MDLDYWNDMTIRRAFITGGIVGGAFAGAAYVVYKMIKSGGTAPMEITQPVADLIQNTAESLPATAAAPLTINLYKFVVTPVIEPVGPAAQQLPVATTSHSWLEVAVEKIVNAIYSLLLWTYNTAKGLVQWAIGVKDSETAAALKSSTIAATNSLASAAVNGASKAGDWFSQYKDFYAPAS